MSQSTVTLLNCTLNTNSNRDLELSVIHAGEGDFPVSIGDVISYDLLTGVQLYVKEVSGTFKRRTRILKTTLLQKKVYELELKYFIPGVQFSVISTVCGET